MSGWRGAVVVLGFATWVAAQVQMAPVTGVVVDAQQAAVAGAEVELWVGSGPDLRWIAAELGPMWRCINKARTGRDGRFGLQGPLGVLCQLRVEHPAHAIYRDTIRPADGDLRVLLRPPCVLAGRVHRAGDPGGLPATVRVMVDLLDWLQVRTDAEGNYRCERLPSGSLRVGVEPDAAVAPQDVWLDFGPGQPTGYSPALATGSAIAGTVLDAETGAPIAGAELHAGWWAHPRARSDAQGHFTMQGFGGPKASLHCLANGYQRRIWVQATAAPGEPVLGLTRGTTMHGKVVDEAGKPLTGVAVRSIGVESSTQTYFRFAVTGSTDGSGDYHLPGNGYDELFPTILVAAEGRAWIALEGQRKFTDLRFGPSTLPLPRLLRGRVFGADGKPRAGVRVGLWGGNDDRFASPRQRQECRGSHYESEMAIGWRFAHTDQGGNFAFGDLPPGTFDLEVADDRDRLVRRVADIVVRTTDPPPLRVVLED